MPCCLRFVYAFSKHFRNSQFLRLLAVCSLYTSSFGACKQAQTDGNVSQATSHFVLNSIADVILAEPSTELPITRSVRISGQSKPRNLIVIVAGILFAPKDGALHCDAVLEWSGSKKAFYDNGRTPSGIHKIPFRLIPLVSNGEVLIDVPIAEGKSVKRMRHKGDQVYSFKQNRSVVWMNRDQGIEGLRVDVPEHVNSRFRGFLRVQIYDGGASQSDNGWRPQVRMEFMGGDEGVAAGEEQQATYDVGRQLSVEGESVVLRGEFLVPVGVPPEYLSNPAKTSRRVELRQGSNATLRISGLYIFGSCYPMVPARIGGGGGNSDLLKREDWPNRPVVNCTDAIGLHVYGLDGVRVPGVRIEATKAPHTVLVKFTAPGPVFLYINDDVPHKTMDNAGALLVDVLKSEAP